MMVAIAPFVFSGYAVKAWLEHRRSRLEIQRGGSKKELEGMKAERKLLVERIENLESIVCSVDFELNQKLARVIDEQRLIASSPGVAVAPAVAAVPAARALSVVPGGDAQPEPATAQRLGTDRTLTAAITPSTTPAPSSARLPGAADLRPGDNLANRYRIQRVLGRGGMGAVYLADDEVLGDLVALKVISSAWAADEAAMIERFKREAQAARKVSSPHVIRIHDLGEARAGLLYLSMEFFPGRTLSEVISQRGLVPMADCRDYLAQICIGLCAAHDVGVIHRDLKPQNVLVGERGAIKIIDFGLAKATAADGLTATGMLLGTPNYMAPEQIRGKNVDARADVYSLGALAYHLVTGRPPFSGDNAIAVGFAHLSEPPTPPRQLRADVPESVERAILAALAKNPGDRPATPLVFRDALA